MLKYLFLMTLLLTVGTSYASAQSCQNYSVADSEKRDFTAQTISIDVDGDRQADSITARVYKQKIARKPRSKVTETHWIAFDLKTSRGRMIKSFFKYKYGDNLADYWVFALVPCRADRDGRTDLLFYAGDDTSDERIIIRNLGSSFKVFSRKVTEY